MEGSEEGDGPSDVEGSEEGDGPSEVKGPEDSDEKSKKKRKVRESKQFKLNNLLT